jgi:hypothetical protein
MHTIVFVTMTVFLIGCQGSDNGKGEAPCLDCLPSKSFSIDYSLPELKVAVHGRKMGTPDATIVDAYLKGQEVNGLIDRLEVVATGTEGGATYCVLLSDEDSRKIVLDDLQRIQTDPEETSYELSSLTGSCTP